MISIRAFADRIQVSVADQLAASSQELTLEEAVAVHAALGAMIGAAQRGSRDPATLAGLIGRCAAINSA